MAHLSNDLCVQFGQCIFDCIIWTIVRVCKMYAHDPNWHLCLSSNKSKGAQSTSAIAPKPTNRWQRRQRQRLRENKSARNKANNNGSASQLHNVQLNFGTIAEQKAKKKLYLG